MSIVYCLNVDCIHCVDEVCRKCSDIRVGCDFECGCEDYSNYMDTAEYQSEYYKCVKGNDGKVYKSKRKGKRVEYKDLVFFTENHPASVKNCTEEKTGYWIGDLKVVKDKYDKIVEMIKGIPDVRELPDVPEERGEGIEEH